MENILNTPVDLSIEIGSGYISYDELHELDVDQCFIMNTNAGDSYLLKANNDVICAGDAIISYPKIGFRINNIHTRSKKNEIPFQIDELTQLLPTEIRFVNFKASISELQGLSTGSFLVFDDEFSEEIDTSFYVMGMPVAKGKLVLVGERMGILIKKLLVKKSDTISENKKIENSGYRYLYRLSGENIKEYDLRRPDYFTWNQIKRAELLHLTFINSFAQQIEMKCDAVCLKLDQMNFIEYKTQLTEKFSYYVYNLQFNQPFRHSRKLSKKIVLESSSITYKVPADVVNMMEKYLSNTDDGSLQMLVAINNEVAAFAEREHFTDIIQNCLRLTWAKAADCTLTFSRCNDDRNTIDIIQENEMVLTVDFFLHERRIISMLYPFKTLEPVLALLS